MKWPSFFTPYRVALQFNSVILVLLGALYGGGLLWDSFGLLLLFMLVAVLWNVAELLLLVHALVTSQLRVALVYGLMTLAIAQLNGWLLEQIQ